MNGSTRAAGKRPRVLRCSYCGRTFARTEHLTRHERSHRQEKPFKCNYCDSTFTRKDVIKRHHERYHPCLSDSLPMTDMHLVQTIALAEPMDEQRIPISMTSGPAGMGGYPDDFDVLPNTTDQQPLDKHNALDILLPSLGCGQASGELLFGSFGQASGHCLDIDIATADTSPFTPSCTASLPSLRNQLSWKGSTDISPTKRNEIAQEVTRVIGEDELTNTFRLPSCLALERLLASFFDAFGRHLPCIHIPTWRAETAHISLLLAMLAMSAYYQGEHHNAHVLYQAARIKVSEHLEKNHIAGQEPPVWLIQSVLFLMAYGTSGGRYGDFNEALSWTSLLASMVRRMKPPNTSLSEEGELDPSASWKQWIECETALRTTWACFCYLNNLLLCFNVAPALLNCEIAAVQLPSHESEWTCAAPESWFEIRNQVPHTPSRFSEAFESLSVCAWQGNSIRISGFGTYVLLHAILQRMWFQRVISIPSTPSSHLQTSTVALERWQTYWEQHSESSTSPYTLHGALPINTAALFRLAQIRIQGDFSAVRWAIQSQDVEKIARSMLDSSVTISRSQSSLKAALHAIHALRMRIKLGMALKAGGVGSHQSLQIHLVSTECCLFSHHWVRAISALPESEWTDEERNCMSFGEEAVEEVELDAVRASRPHSIKLVYAWATILERCAGWGIQSILAKALNRYGDELSNLPEAPP